MALVPVAEAVGDNDNRDGKNKGGLAFFVKGDNGIKHEVGRVAYERSNGLWKDKDFDTAVDEMMERTKKTITAVHELQEFAGQLV